MATLSPTGQIKVGGTQIQKVQADVAGDSFAPGRVQFIVDNASAGAVTVTIAVPGNSKYGAANPDIETAIPAGQEFAFGPFGEDLADPATGRVMVTYSSVTTVTCALLRA